MEVSQRLQKKGVPLLASLTGEVLRAYGRIDMSLQIAEVQETAS